MKNLKRTIKLILRRFANGKIPFIGSPLYRLVIGQELIFQQIFDSFQIKPLLNEQVFAKQNLTAVVKTHERPRLLKRLITSIRRYYPCLHIIVVDDSNSPLMIDGVQTIVLPYNSGVSLGRIEGLKQVMTKYILLLDDDFVFFRHTNLVNSLTIMEQFPKIDIMGGQVINLPYFSTVDYRNALIYPTKAESTFPKESLIGGMPVYDIVANFFIGRTDRVRIVGWTPELKRIDHNDFFSRAKGVLTTVFNKDLKCLHARNPYDSNYMKNRSETTQDLEILQNRYYRNKISG